MKPLASRIIFFTAFALVFLAAAYFRTAGLFRGLDSDRVFHPDAPKQVRQLDNYLHGNYQVWYGNHFYDGYPYGLNRVDELVLRAVSPLVDFLRSSFSANPSLPSPPYSSLYVSARLLRAAYGLLALLLLYLAARRWGVSPPLSLAAASLYALAPLASVVTHSATGDVGIDLCTAIALFALASHARNGSLASLAALAAAAGLAFACKFQGALLAYLAIPPILLALADRPRPLRRFFLASAIALLAAVAAVLVANPVLFLDPRHAFPALWDNFEFIKNYNVPPEQLAWPFSRRLAYGLSVNVPFIASCLGLLTLLAALPPALLLAAASLLPARVRTRLLPRLDASRPARCAFALATYPLLAFFLATAFKLVVQPFHFSALLLPLALAAAVAVHSAVPVPPASSRPRKLAALLLALLLALALADALRISIREAFLWRRPDVSLAALRLSKALFGVSGHGRKYDAPSNRIKHFVLEPSTLPVFRNGPSSLKPAPGLWPLGRKALPVPSIPLPDHPDPYWIFLNGPRFPADDRSFAALPGAWTERGLVFPSPSPAPLLLGVRSGSAPLRLDIRLPGVAPRSIFLPPEAQRILSLPAPRPSLAHPDASIAILRLRASLGPAYVSVLGDQEEVDAFDFFGPAPRPLPPPSLLIDPSDVPALQRNLDRLAYLDLPAPLPVPTDKPSPLFVSPLPAGAYRLRASVAFAQPAVLTLSIPGTDISTTVSAPSPGVLPVSWTFSKPFAPYDTPLSVSASAPGVVLLEASLRPDAAALAATPPAPRSPSPDDASTPIPLDLHYPSVATLTSLRIPAEIHAGVPFPFSVRAVLDPSVSTRTLAATAVFVHVLDPSGHLAAALDIPLKQATFDDAPSVLASHLRTLDLPPGPYTLAVGLFRLDHPRQRKLHPRPAPADPAEKHASPPIPFTLLP